MTEDHGTPPLPETVLSELRRFTRFGPDDEEVLLALRAPAAARADQVVEDLFRRWTEHHEAMALFESPEHLARVRQSLREWLVDVFRGPWDEAHFRQREAVGRHHVRAGVPQRYLFAAMSMVRLEVTRIAEEHFHHDAHRRDRARAALSRVLDLELALMVESFRHSYVEELRGRERAERSLLRERLAVSEARYAEVVENTVTLIVTFDRTGRIRLFNRCCEETTGIPREEARGQSFFELFVPPAERSRVRALCERVRTNQRRPPSSWEGPGNCAAPGTCRFRWHFSPMSGDGPDDGLVCAIGLDVSDEHELAVRTRRAERLASLGTMAAGLAHEIRNPLNAAHLQLTVVQRRLSRAEGPDVRGALAAAELVAGEVQRLAGLVESFLQFARPQPLQLARVDLRATVASLVAAIRPDAAEAGVDLALLPGPPVLAHADDERIRQVLENLVRNAIEATGEGGHVVVCVADRGHEACIEVEDDGPGLPSLDAPIFEPFFTTKSDATGLGLAIVHRIVTDHGGRVAVESAPGRTVFSVHVPTGTPPDAGDAAEPDGPSSPPGA